MQERPETSEMALRKEDLEQKKVAQVRRQDVSRQCHEQKKCFRPISASGAPCDLSAMNYMA